MIIILDKPHRIDYAVIVLVEMGTDKYFIFIIIIITAQVSSA